MAFACVGAGCTGATSDPEAVVQRIVITPASGSVVIGETQRLDAVPYTAAGARITGRIIAWATVDSAIALVDSAGLIRGRVPGTTVVTAATGGRTGRALIAITPERPTGPLIAVWPSVTYQTMIGWEGTAQTGHLECDRRAYRSYRDTLLDRVVGELGLNRVRLELRSGQEHPVDYFTPYREGAAARPTWRSRWYEVVNDNADPDSIDPAGFQFAASDYDIEQIVLPLRERLAARGERLYVNLNYVDFGRSAFEHSTNAAEYGEFLLAAFQHMQAKYGFVPDAVEISLEPDNTPNWGPGAIAAAIVAAGDRLATAGFRPDFIAPSTTNASRALEYLDEIVRHPRVLEYLTDISYHRYSGASAATIRAIGDRAVQYGLRAGMLEHIGSGVADLYEDLTAGRNSTWQQYAIGDCTPGDDGGRYYVVDVTDPRRPVVRMGSRTRLLRHYFARVRAGAVRIGAASGDQRFAPLAFRNPSGAVVVVVRASSGGSFRVQGLPAGAYVREYTTVRETAVALPDVILREGGTLEATLPAAGVMTIYSR